jgi:hypothetical protein
MGFGVMASVVTNNVAAMAALANGMLPLRRIAQERAEQELKEELREMYRPDVELQTEPQVIEAAGVRTLAVTDLNDTVEDPEHEEIDESAAALTHVE